MINEPTLIPSQTSSMVSEQNTLMDEEKQEIPIEPERNELKETYKQIRARGWYCLVLAFIVAILFVLSVLAGFYGIIMGLIVGPIRELTGGNWSIRP